MYRAGHLRESRSILHKKRLFNRLIVPPHHDHSPAIASLGAHISFKCGSEAGALLVNGPAAHTRVANARGLIDKYMRTYFKSWTAFSDALGFDLDDEDIYFVYGVTRTRNWAVAAFRDSYERTDVTVSGTLGWTGGGAGTHFSIGASNQTFSDCQYRVGPSSSERGTPSLLSPPPSPRSSRPLEDFPALSAAPSHTVSPPVMDQTSQSTQPTFLRVPTPYGANDNTVSEGDQCIFLKYFKMKRRSKILPARPLRAAAGPDELPKPGPDSSATGPIAMELDPDYDMENSDDDDEFPLGFEKVRIV